MASVVISGVSGRFPESDNIDHFYEKLLRKDSFGVPFGSSFDDGSVTTLASRIQTTAKFDQTFFPIHSRIINVLDPLCRVFIEPCFEAILDAGLTPRSLAKSNTGVYTGSSISDDESLGCDERITTNFWLLAHVRCLLANRISYLFDFKGPSYTIDNSWTNGLESLRQAYNDIREGRVNSALVGVSNLLLNPKLNHLFDGMNRLSPDGKTRSFDQDANGYGRSEGVVVLFLQRSDQCFRSYGEILNVDSLFYASLDRPFCSLNANNLMDFFTEFYKRAKVDPNSVDFLEADGSAVKSLDSVELNIISQIFCKNRSKPLKLGSVKSNIGHSEGASALMSIAKALIALNSNTIAPNNNFNKPNGNLHSKVKVVDEPTSLDGNLVGVNCFSLSGSVSHILLKRHSAQNKTTHDKPYPRLVLVASRTEKGIAKIIEKIESMPFSNDFCSLLNETFKERINGLFYSGYTLLPPPRKPVHGSIQSQNIKRPVWFVYAGMGSQWPGMAAELMQFKPFRDAIDKCDKVYRPLGLDIKNIISSKDPETFNDILNSFVGIVACQIGLTNILKAVGIEPEGYLGHSLGENGCAYVDDCFTIEEACLGGYARGYASKILKVKPGLMVSVGLNYKDLADLPPSVDIACHNSDDNTTISGTKEDILPFLDKLKARNIFYRVVNSSEIAYHSRQVIPLASTVQKIFEKAVPNPKKRSSKWISTSISEDKWDTPLAQYSSAAYHVNNFLNTVRFMEACAYIPENAIVIEIAPHGLMQSLLKRNTNNCVNVPLCRRQAESPANFLLAALGQLYMHGLEPNIEVLYEPAKFPVNVGTPSISPLISWNHEDDWDVSVSSKSKEVKEINLFHSEYRTLFSHQVEGKVLPPMAFFLVEVYKKLCSVQSRSESEVFICENYKMSRLLSLDGTVEPTIKLKTEIFPASGSFEQLSSNESFSTGKAFFGEPDFQRDDLPTLKVDLEKKKLNDNNYTIDVELFYELFRDHLYELNPPFDDVVKQVYVYDDGCHAQIMFNGDLMIYLDIIMKVKIFFELQDDQVPVFPHVIRRFMLSSKIVSSLKPGDIVDVYFDFDTEEIFAPGVYISKLRCSSFSYENKKEDNVKINSVNFVPHFTSLQKNIGTKKFLYCLIQLMIDNFSFKKKDTQLSIVSVNNCFPTDIVKHIQNKLSTVAQVEVASGASASASCDLLLCSYQSLMETSQLNAHFLLVSCSPSDVIDQSLNIVAHYQYKEEALVLIKSKIGYEAKPMKYTVIRPETTSNWMKSLKTKDTPLLIWEEANVNVQTTMKQINAMGYPVVCIFLLDENAPKFSLEDSFYQQQLSKQLKVNVFKNGEWGSYYYENVNLVPETKQPIIMPEFFGSAKYLGLNLKDSTINIDENERKQEIGHIEFSGMIEGGGRIMGLAHYDSDTCAITPDPDLTWNVPPEWNLQDAVTVPLVYTTVYYALVNKLQSDILRNEASILIHAGHTILGQAAICFSLSRGWKVFTTVPDVARYAPILKQQFPKLQTCHMYELYSSDFESNILLETKGLGVAIVFSAISGDLFESTFRCTQPFGNFIQLSDKDMKKNRDLGLNIFLKSVAFFSLSLVDVFSLNKEDKKQIKNLIDRDIDAGVIQPFKRKIFDNTQTHDALRALQTESQEVKIVLSLTRNPNSDSLFTCLPNRSYFVAVNSSVQTHCWLNIIGWLLKRSARRIIIAFEPSIHNDYVDKRFNDLIAQYKDSTFIFVPLSSLNKKKTITQAFNNVIQNKIHTLDAVFTFQLDEKKLQNLDASLREVAPNLPVFLCLQSNSEEICESRRSVNMPSLCVQCSSPCNLVKYLDTLSLECNAMATSSLFILQPKVFDFAISRNIFQDIFPLSIEELLLISKDIVVHDNFTFTQVHTKSPGLNYSNEVLPLFYVTALCSSYLQKLFNQLLYPTFCSQMPSNISSIQDYARGLHRSLKSIQKQGPYTIIGEIWSSCVVMEIAKLLEKGGDPVTIILLEGLPDTVETALQDIACIQSSTLELELLGELVQVENNVSLKKSWNENMDQILSSVDEPDKRLCKLTLESLTNQIILSSKYAQSQAALSDKIQSTIVYICFSHASILSTYSDFGKYHSGELVLKVSETSSYSKLLELRSTADTINDYAMVFV